MLPEIAPAVNIFRMVMTQWRVNGSRAIGLDYNVVFKLLDRLSSGDAWDQIFDDIRILENAALEAIYEGAK